MMKNNEFFCKDICLFCTLLMYFFELLQYNKQHIIPLEEVKLELLVDDERKYS